MTTKKKTQEKRLCYVIMPFSKHVGIDESEWTDVYETIFKPAIEGSGFGYRCERSSITTGSFTKDIVENMKNAHVVLADITGFNGNVMWELGVRHALSPRTIMVSRNNVTEKKVISDLGTYGVHFYENNGRGIENFKKEMKETLKEFEINPDKLDSPVFDVIQSEERILSSREQKLKISKLKGLLTELIEDLRYADMMLDEKDSVANKHVTYNRFLYVAIDELLVTNYVVLKDLPLAVLNLKNWFLHSNHGLDNIKENMALDKSDKHRTKTVKKTKEMIKESRSRLIDLISIINDTILSLKRGTLQEDVEPDVVMHLKKYKKLLK